MKLVNLLGVSVIALLVGACGSGVGYERIAAGNVGVRVSGYGDAKGVQKVELGTGTIHYNPLTEQVFQFPTYLQNYTWTKDSSEGSEGDESLSFNTKDGIVVNTDVNVQFTYQRDRVDEIVQRYRTDADTIRNGVIRGAVRDAINKEAGKYSLTQSFGEKKAAILEDATASLNKRFSPNVTFEAVSFVGALRVAESVQNQLNEAAKASFEAKEAESNLAVAKTNALIAVEKGKEQRALNASLSPALIQKQWIEKWDGKLSVYNGGSNPPMIQLPAAGK